MPSEPSAELDRKLDELESRLGLPNAVGEETKGEAARLLSLPPSALSRLTAEECRQASYVLSQFSLWLQRSANKESARARWAEEKVWRVLGAEVARQPAYDRRERLACAIAGNEEASEADRVRAASQVRLERLAYLSQKVDGMAGAMSGLGWSKRQREGREGGEDG